MEQGVKKVLDWFKNNNKREGAIITDQQLLNVLPRISEAYRKDYDETIQKLIDRGYLRKNSKQQQALTDIGERAIYQ